MLQNWQPRNWGYKVKPGTTFLSHIVWPANESSWWINVTKGPGWVSVEWGEAEKPMTGERTECCSGTRAQIPSLWDSLTDTVFRPNLSHRAAAVRTKTDKPMKGRAPYSCESLVKIWRTLSVFLVVPDPPTALQPQQSKCLRDLWLIVRFGFLALTDSASLDAFSFRYLKPPFKWRGSSVGGKANEGGGRLLRQMEVFKLCWDTSHCFHSFPDNTDLPYSSCHKDYLIGFSTQKQYWNTYIHTTRSPNLVAWSCHITKGRVGTD